MAALARGRRGWRGRILATATIATVQGLAIGFSTFVIVSVVATAVVLGIHALL
jgi:hypothetical protein